VLRHFFRAATTANRSREPRFVLLDRHVPAETRVVARTSERSRSGLRTALRTQAQAAPTPSRRGADPKSMPTFCKTFPWLIRVFSRICDATASTQAPGPRGVARKVVRKDASALPAQDGKGIVRSVLGHLRTLAPFLFLGKNLFALIALALGRAMGTSRQTSPVSRRISGSTA
jgi:hypothetical protein